jgi:hypothetical protein
MTFLFKLAFVGYQVNHLPYKVIDKSKRLIPFIQILAPISAPFLLPIGVDRGTTLAHPVGTPAGSNGKLPFQFYPLGFP